MDVYLEAFGAIRSVDEAVSNVVGEAVGEELPPIRIQLPSILYRPTGNAPCGIRTCDLRFRKALLYPAELRGHRKPEYSGSSIWPAGSPQLSKPVADGGQGAVTVPDNKDEQDDRVYREAVGRHGVPQEDGREARCRQCNGDPVCERASRSVTDRKDRGEGKQNARSAQGPDEGDPQCDGVSVASVGVEPCEKTVVPEEHGSDQRSEDVGSGGLSGGLRTWNVRHESSLPTRRRANVNHAANHPRDLQ